jgi:murein DD-endopeptidase MepM/ murein hydrolase activator NlpD
MARRGLQAYAVPSAQAGQHTDPSARRDALSGLMTGGFLMAVIAAVLAIVIGAPQYAKPAVAALPSPSVEPSASIAVESLVEVPTSKTPDKLKGYRWPVRGGGMVARYYARDKNGHFSIAGDRVHGGLEITWFEGAAVKAAHSGTVLAAGQDWIEHAGYNGNVRALYKKRKGKRSEFSSGVVIDDGNGYHSVITNLKKITVKPDDKVKAGAVIGYMARTDERQFARYQLVRMDGEWMKVSGPARKQGYPDYAREHVDPLVVMNLNSKKAPSLTKRLPPKNPPRLSAY